MTQFVVSKALSPSSYDKGKKNPQPSTMTLDVVDLIGSW